MMYGLTAALIVQGKFSSMENLRFFRHTGILPALSVVCCMLSAPGLSVIIGSHRLVLW